MPTRPAQDDLRLSKTMSHALRHSPEQYGLELAADGSVPLAEFVRAISTSKQKATEADVRRVVAESDKQRFAIDGGRIRAQYGHSTAVRIVKRQVVPTGDLFHATSPAAVNLIVNRRQGLLPMGRQYVHLTTDPTLALDAGRRKAAQPMLLRIDAVRAHDAGVTFSEGHDRVILADQIPTTYIRVEPVGGLMEE